MAGPQVQPMDESRNGHGGLKRPPVLTTMVNFRMPITIANEVDRIAIARGTSTSAVLRDAVTLFLRSLRGSSRP